ncbi:hypothetical protein P170DRAFT_480886 [Aspergillus steynii IBT 23096]|uniref:Uncharacterized protein n=1 Tax=Aspergillus steynii IBT 23096 TaxID=1392250 RepID=A0A2I2FTI8_9EURO|nr:uncharacterized protein P170DRAFT_480886 [Aspergillus steynii IBT 23096]PLB43942.1 hypothetical protein P170DRAFT_480886 [Aspergillus steynii IBT 23096]
MSYKWAEFFLQGCEPNIFNLYNQPILDPEDFKQFHCDDAWKLGRRMRDDMPGMHSIMVLRLRVNGRAKLVTKTVHTQNESRAYEHILRNCPPSKLSYFPTYYGVVLNLTREKYPMSYALRPRALVLERVSPAICSRRLLGESPRPSSSLFESFVTKIGDLPLSSFEKEWYISLSIDQLQRLAALHDIGILHHDICDEHFRMPHDFYDTVLYHFSHSYTIHTPWPYVRRPKPLVELIRIEQEEVLSGVLGRARKSDLRDNVATTLDVTPVTVLNFCSQELEDTENNLELISLKTKHRPDGTVYASIPDVNISILGIDSPESFSSMAYQ